MLDLTAEQKRRRWLALGIVALAYVLSFFQRFAPAGIAQDLAASFSTSAASLGALAATYFYVYTLMQIPTGILADTLGPRRILALGGVIGGLGSFMFGFAPSLDWALAGRTLIGLGSRDAIIQAENSPQPLEGTSNQGTGGPSLADAQALQSLLEGKTRDMSFEEISKEIQDLRAEAEVRLASVQSLSQRITEERALFRSTPNIWPTNGYLTSHFGPRLSPTHGFEENHKGMDIAGPAGSPVRVTADGVVKLARWAGGYGKVVVVDHGFGYSTRYGHNRQLLVQAGERVRRGQIVALMGETGNATGPHCHYEVWYNGRAVNPGKFLKRPSS
jgi:ABC-type multidrug transport system fused ATPase/permease subunit